MSVVVFLGPSLSHEVARDLLPVADVRPPAAAGDVLRAVLDGATAIGLIDGYFHQVPSVWHKELLYALDRGVSLLGSSSMGALRAAEMQPFGMIGVGGIFADFVSGRFNDDDEVTLAHGDATTGYENYSEAMVNLRSALTWLESEELVSEDQATALVAGLKALFYPQRTWHRLWALLREEGIAPEELEKCQKRAREGLFDRKAADARELLTRLATDTADVTNGATRAPNSHGWRFPSTTFWNHLYEFHRLDHEQSTSGIAAEDLLALVRVVLGDNATARREALQLALGQREAARRGIDLASARPQDARDPQGGHSALWARLLETTPAHHIDSALLRVVSSSDSYSDIMAEIRDAARWVRQRSVPEHPEQAGLTLEELLLWYSRRFRKIESMAHYKRLGFRSPKDFVRALTHLYLYEQSREKGPPSDG